MRVRERLSASLPADIESDWPPAFERLIDGELMERTANLVPERGSSERIAQIGWWGAAVCWITAPPSSEKSTYQAAAAFNVAVAAFDTLIERDRKRSAALVDALAPHHLARVLADPRREDFRASGHECSPVAELFHAALSGFASRWDKNPDHLALGLRLLTEMYRSEVGHASDPMPAKALPSVFLGSIGTDRCSHLHMHRALGSLIAAWDDWMDLDEDLLRLRPNLYLGVARGLTTPTYLGRALTLAASEKAKLRVIAQLQHRLGEFMGAVNMLEPAPRARAVDLVTALVG